MERYIERGRIMNFIKNLKISQKLALILLAFMIGFLLFLLNNYNILKHVKVNEKNYKELILGKDLVADILPPPEYIIESYLTVFEMQQNIDDSRKIEELSDYLINKLKKEYYERHEFWGNDSIFIVNDNELRDAMVKSSYRYADEFFKVAEQEFLPAIKNKDKRKVNEMLTGKLKTLV